VQLLWTYENVEASAGVKSTYWEAEVSKVRGAKLAAHIRLEYSKRVKEELKLYEKADKSCRVPHSDDSNDDEASSGDNLTVKHNEVSSGEEEAYVASCSDSDDDEQGTSHNRASTNKATKHQRNKQQTVKERRNRHVLQRTSKIMSVVLNYGSFTPIGMVGPFLPRAFGPPPMSFGPSGFLHLTRNPLVMCRLAEIWIDEQATCYERLAKTNVDEPQLVTSRAGKPMESHHE
jgi:hypothetical protein